MQSKDIDYIDPKTELALSETSDLHTAGLGVACLHRMIHPSDSNIVKMSLCHLPVIPRLHTSPHLQNMRSWIRVCLRLIVSWSQDVEDMVNNTLSERFKVFYYDAWTTRMTSIQIHLCVVLTATSINLYHVWPDRPGSETIISQHHRICWYYYDDEVYNCHFY